MPVAKTYEQFEIDGDIFMENKRNYVNIKTPKGIKKVRWYSDTEYARMYPEKKNDLMNFNARQAFGFGEKGYITLYKGDSELIERWVENDHTNIWYNLTFNYYTPSKFPTPEVLNGITPIQLKWEQVMDYNDRMKPHEEVAKLVRDLICDCAKKNSISSFQGTEGAWIEKEVIVTKNSTRKNNFGEKHTHYMSDSEGNTYIWETGTKNFEVDTKIKLKMKVKAHQEINNERCTIVWYCKEI